MAAAPLGIPVVLWDGNVIPGRSGPGDGPAGRARWPSRSTRPARRWPARSGRPCYVTGTPIRDIRDLDR